VLFSSDARVEDIIAQTFIAGKSALFYKIDRQF
jgi:hypothetical protein